MYNPIGWGKCSVIVKDLDEDNSSWVKLATPKEDTTTLTASQGDKKEASIEGGGNEDIKYSRSTYALSYAIRLNTTRSMPIKAVDGTVTHRYAVFVQPENINVPGPLMQKSTVSLEDNFDTTDGGLLTYTHDGILPDDNSNTVKWCKASIDLSTIAEGETISGITFTDVDTDATVEIATTSLATAKVATASVATASTTSTTSKSTTTSKSSSNS